MQINSAQPTLQKCSKEKMEFDVFYGDKNWHYPTLSEALMIFDILCRRGEDGLEEVARYNVWLLA